MRIHPTEAQEQKALFWWAAMHEERYPALRWMFHIPNGGSRHIREAVSLKSQGTKAGVSDIFLPAARGGYHGLWIELKSMTGQPSDLQKQFVQDMWERGYKALICWGADQAIEEIKAYLKQEET